MDKKSKYQKDDKFFNVPSVNLKKLWSHPNFYQDFRQVKINWLLMLLGLVFIVFLIATDGLIVMDGQRIYIYLGFPLMILYLVFLILIQGEWQKFDEDRQIIDISVYLIFIVTAMLMYMFYDAIITSTMIIMIILVRRYLANRENRLAQLLRE